MSDGSVPYRMGPEYPAYLEDNDGVRMPLERERRWSRTFRHPTKQVRYHVPRFMDGSASISFDELRAGWDEWSSADRLDFCTNAKWLHRQPDFNDMLRFLAGRADAKVASTIALPISTYLPRDEAFALLVGMLDGMDASSSANLLQAIATTAHESARDVLELHLRMLLADPRIQADDAFINWTAFTAICAIKHLLQLGSDPFEHESDVRALSQHPCARVRDTCSRYVGHAYPWLPAPKEGHSV